MKQTTQHLAQILHIAAAAGCTGFKSTPCGVIFASKENKETNSTDVLVINPGNSSRAYEQNCQNLMTVCSNMDYSLNPNVPEGKEDDVLFSAIANIREAGVSREMVENLKIANKELKFAAMSGENSNAISQAMALNEGLVNFATNQASVEVEFVNAEAEIENDGPVMEKDFNN